MKVFLYFAFWAEPEQQKCELHSRAHKIAIYQKKIVFSSASIFYNMTKFTSDTILAAGWV